MMIHEWHIYIRESLHIYVNVLNRDVSLTPSRDAAVVRAFAGQILRLISGLYSPMVFIFLSLFVCMVHLGLSMVSIPLEPLFYLPCDQTTLMCHVFYYLINSPAIINLSKATSACIVAISSKARWGQGSCVARE